MKTIRCTLSASSLRDTAKELKKYAESLKPKTEKLVEALGKYGERQAKANLTYNGLDADYAFTRSTIQFQQQGLTGSVSVMGRDAAFIEFGSGVYANSGYAPHPKRDEVGALKWGEYGKGQGANIGGWYYYNERVGGKLWHTYGIPYNPFMYSTSQEMRYELVKIAKGVFMVR